LHDCSAGRTEVAQVESALRIEFILPSGPDIMILLPLLIWYSRRSEPLSIRDLQRSLAILLIALFLVPSDATVSSCKAAEKSKTEETQLLREGTRVPLTTGRIVMLGRRWAFVPVREEAEGKSNSPPLSQIILQENLMLQRIAKAINTDASDDHWIITGEVTEFFSENRLMIQLAQRAGRQ